MADFSVTSCTCSRSIVAPEDTIDITMTIKNTSGGKIIKAGLCLCFTYADMGYPGEGWWAPVVQPGDILLMGKLHVKDAHLEHHAGHDSEPALVCLQL